MSDTLPDDPAELRIAYANAILKDAARLTRSDLEIELAALGEIEQFLVDMLDYFEQTEFAEPAIISALRALCARRAQPNTPESVVDSLRIIDEWRDR